MPKGCTIRAELNPTLRTKCANCEKSICTETGHYIPEKEYEIRGLIGEKEGKKTIFPTCSDCYDTGWRPPGFTWY